MTVFIADTDKRWALVSQSSAPALQRGLVRHGQHDGVSARRYRACLAGCMCDLSRKKASWHVTSDDDVMGDGVGACRGGLTVNRS